MNEDYRDVLAALQDERARFLVAGAHALAVHGVPRATGDLDIWVERSKENAGRVWRALQAFGAPLDALGVTAADFYAPDRVIQVGVRPRRIDFLTDVTGTSFERAWPDRVCVELEGIEVPFIGRRTLLENKRATGRLKDRADLEALGEPERPGPNG